MERKKEKQGVESKLRKASGVFLDRSSSSQQSPVLTKIKTYSSSKMRTQENVLDLLIRERFSNFIHYCLG